MFASASIPQATEGLRLTDHEVDEIRSLSEICMTLPAIAILLKLPLQALLYCIESDERVKNAVYVSRANAEKSIALALFKSADAGNVAAAIWLEKTRFNRAEPARTIAYADETKELIAS